MNLEQINEVKALLDAAAVQMKDRKLAVTFNGRTVVLDEATMSLANAVNMAKKKKKSKPKPY